MNAGPPFHSYFEILTPKVMVLVGGASGSDQVVRTVPS